MYHAIAKPNTSKHSAVLDTRIETMRSCLAQCIRRQPEVPRSPLSCADFGLLIPDFGSESRSGRHWICNGDAARSGRQICEIWGGGLRGRICVGCWGIACGRGMAGAHTRGCRNLAASI